MIQQQLEHNNMTLFSEPTGFQNNSKNLAYSHALNFLNSVPRFDRRKINYELTRECEDFERAFITTFDKAQYKITITGATITRINKKTGTKEKIVMWPGTREEKVESAILKLASNGGITPPTSTGVRSYGCNFSIFQIREITGMNQGDIKDAIDVLSKSNLDIKMVNGGDSSQTMSATFLPIKYVSEKVGSKNDKCNIVFHPAVMRAIDTLGFRPYEYELAEKHNKSLTKYMHKRLITRYTYAAVNKSYHFKLRNLINDFGKIPSDQIISDKALKNLRRDMRISLNELVDCEVIAPRWTCEATKDNQGEIVDYKFEVLAAPQFAKAQKLANHIMGEKEKKLILKYPEEPREIEIDFSTTEVLAKDMFS